VTPSLESWSTQRIQFNMDLRVFQQGAPTPESPVARALRAAQRLGQLARLERPETGTPFSHGIPIALSSNLALLREIAVEQFRPDGYGIYRLGDIADVRSDEHERFFEHLLAAEGIVSMPQNMPDVDITDWVSALGSAYLAGHLIAVEAEYLPEPEYWVGRLEHIDAESVSLLCVGSTGVWDSDPLEIEIGDVSCVHFGTRYLDVYARHVAGPG
jgi:hypothetical protein